VAVLDVLKGLLVAAAFGFVAHEAGLVAGLAAVLGHVTSPWLRGRGGKGVATAFGAVLGSHPLWAPVVALVWFAVVAGTRWIALASVTACAAVVACALVAGEDRSWALGLLAVVAVRHRGNIGHRPVHKRAGDPQARPSEP
jgi:glycerol-3-phosphate acyltransferase PlsY